MMLRTRIVVVVVGWALFRQRDLEFHFGVGVQVNGSLVEKTKVMFELYHALR